MNKIRPAKIRNVSITDPFFGSYAALVADSIIPYQWEILNDRIPEAEKSHCIENFRIAAGEIQGTRQGVVFCDTDAYKWLEAVAFCIENGSGARFEALADGLIDLIGRAQQPDGYLNTYYTLVRPGERWTNLTEGHELYSAGHLIEAAVAYESATGKKALLNIAVRFADLICDTFGDGEGQCRGYPGHQEIELALVKLYHATENPRYLEQAAYFINVRGAQPNYLLREIEGRNGDMIFPEFAGYDSAYSQSHDLPAQQKTAEGHAVRAMYMYSAMASLAKERGDAQLASACRVLWDNVTQKRMYITGGIGSSGLLERFTTDYDLPNDRMYCETCASIGLMMFGQRMAMLSGDASYYDVVERALCNTVIAGISAQGNRYFYVNPLEVWPNNCLEHTSMSHVKPVRQPWFSVACCPTNVARTLASLGQYIWAEDDRSVYINQFISSRYTTQLHGNHVAVEIQSSYMHDGTVKLLVESEKPQSFVIRVRIPGYMRDVSFTLNGAPISPAVENGYAVLAVSRAGSQAFCIHATVEAEFTAANLNVPADAGKVAVVKGPYVYCLEEQDNGGRLANVFVSLDRKPVDAPSLEGLPGDLPTLDLAGKRLVRSTRQEDALYGGTDFAFADTRLRAVPYCLWCNRDPGEMSVWMKAVL